MTDYFQIIEAIKNGNDNLPLIPDYLGKPNYKIGEYLDGRYEIKERFHGSRGDVYCCYDHKINEKVAIKTIIGQEKSSRGRLHGFIGEVQLRINLKLHPNVLAFRRILNLDGYYYIVSEWIAGNEQNGNSLSTWIERHQFTQAECINALIQICYGLLHCYENLPGFIFGDLKPENVLISSDGILKLADFSGGYTPKYASPEQIKGDPVDERSDVYSLGQVACAINNVTIIENSDLDDDVCRLIERCIEDTPKDRPDNIRIVLQNLQEICLKYKISPYTPSPVPCSFIDNFNRYAAEKKVYGTKQKAMAPNAYLTASFIKGSGFIHLNEYAEYVSSEDKVLMEAWEKESAGDIQGALSVLSSSIRTSKKANSVYLERARLFIRLGNINDAIKNCDAAILNKDSLEAYDLKANLLMDYPQVVGDHPEIPLLLERLNALPEERYTGYLANQAKAKYYMLSGLYQMASSHFRRSLQYPNADEWLTLYYYGCCEEFLKHTDNQNILFSSVCEQIELEDYYSDLQKCTKLLFSYWKLNNRDRVGQLVVHMKQFFNIDYSSLLSKMRI